MKRPLFASIIAAAVLLCGCDNASSPSVVVPMSSNDKTASQQSSSASPSTSSKESEPESSSSSSLETSSQSGESGESTESSETPSYSSSEEPEINYPEITDRKRVEAGETLIVDTGETYTLGSGTELTVDGKIEIRKGGELKTESGSAIILNGNMELEGDYTASGYTRIEKDALISGGGTFKVVKSFYDIYCEGTVKAKIKAPAPVERNGATYVGDVLIVNKKHSIPKEFGSELIIDDNAGTGLIRDEVYDALLEMREASGYAMPIVSGFRSYNTQYVIFNRNVANDGFEVASTYSAQPGQSEHQTGLAIDISSLEQSYGDTAEGKWLGENCHKFGFIVRYLKSKESVTGYMYEPWHVRYLGKSTAKLVYDSGLALEEFLGVEG